MANPNPQHVPTDGLDVAAYVVLVDNGGRELPTGASALTNPAAGSVDHPGTQGVWAGPDTATHQAGTPTNGQGIGATEGLSASAATAPGFPVAQYACTLSLSSQGAYHNVVQWLAHCVDAKNNVYGSPVGNFVARSLNDPAAGSPAWYNPSNFAGYDPSVASVAASSTNDATLTVTALHVGTAIIEVWFPTFDFESSAADPEPTQDYGNPVMGIYVQVIVTVMP